MKTLRDDIDVLEGVTVNRPFVIQDPIGALGYNLVLTLEHQGRGLISLDVDHPLVEPVGVALSVDAAVELRDVLDSLIEEQAKAAVEVFLG